MDHLRNDQERRNQWYSKAVPRYVPVEPAQYPSNLRNPPVHGVYQKSYSVPFTWLSNSESVSLPNNLLATVLDTHGFVVVSGVLKPSECNEALERAWDWIEAASVSELVEQTKLPANEVSTVILPPPPVIRQDPSTVSSVYFPRAVEGGMMPFYGSGHSTLAWTVRSNPKIKQVFAALHGTTDLISSLDGIVLWRAGCQHATDKGWFHLDQNPRQKPGRACVQGLINLMDASPATGGNVLVPQSHRLFPQHYLQDSNDTNNGSTVADYYRTRLDEIGGDDWMEINPNDEVVLDPQRIITLLLQAGDLLLWDSRTVHCSHPATEDVTDIAIGAGNGLIRAATAVCMLPTQSASEAVLLERKQAVHCSRTLTHWANKVAPLGNERPEHVALESACVNTMKQWQASRSSKVLLDYEDLTLEQKRLVVGNALAH